jgi:general stress protein 26
MSEQNYTGAEGLKKLTELIKEIHFTMFTTANEDGTLHARPMATQKIDENFDGTLWFLTNIASRKVDEIRDDQHVLLNYADADATKFIAVQGRASVSQDRSKIKELWNPIYKAWFPGGESDPSIAVVRVQIAGAEYWDSNSNAVVRFVQMVAAAVTGGKTDVGDTGKIAV